jgi:restriction system protein
MPSQYPYRTTVRNEYLGVSKVIRAMSRDELHWLAEAQLAKWAEQETRRRQTKQKEAVRREAREHAENLKAQAEEDTKVAQQQLDLFRNLLSASLSTDLKIEWEPLLDRRPYPPFEFKDPKPDRDATRLQLLGPKPTEEHVSPPRPEPALVGNRPPVLAGRPTRAKQRC